MKTPIDILFKQLTPENQRIVNQRIDELCKAQIEQETSSHQSQPKPKKLTKSALYTR